MRDEEKVLKQKLSDAEKAKKQLQSDLAGRDRTIQQLKVVRSSVPPPDYSLCGSKIIMLLIIIYCVMYM